MSDLDNLAAERGVDPVRRIEDMADGTWPEDESVDDFLAAIDGEQREWDATMSDGLGDEGDAA